MLNVFTVLLAVGLDVLLVSSPSWSSDSAVWFLTMAALKVISYNVRSLGSPSKLSKLWLEMKRMGARHFLHITISDHAPVSISLHPLSMEARTWSWRLNDNILDDAVALKQVSDTISLYFAENKPGGVGMGSVWEGHKAVVRGELISQGARLKKAREGELQTLLAKIRSAELMHKKNVTPIMASELHALQQELATLLDTKIKARIRHLVHKFYEFGNKCGRLLARALKHQRATGHVHKLTSMTGASVIHSSKIANTFREYYAQLYHLTGTLPGS